MSLGMAILLAPLGGVLARGFGAVSRPRPDRLSGRETPLLGGAVVLIAAFLPLLWFHPRPVEVLGLLAGGVVVFGVGIVDDIRGLTPPQKVVGQVLAACALVATEVALGVYDWGPLTIPIFIFWLVAITNAFNLLDNMDGLAGGVAAITAAVIFLYSSQAGAAVPPQGAGGGYVTLGALCFGAASLGFLLFNLPPARIFLGDNGALLLGLVLASLAAKAGGGAGASGWAVPVLLLGVPIFDTLFVIIGRARAGRPITRGGKDHLSHRLLDFGLPTRKTLYVLYFLSAVMGGVILLLGRRYPLPLVIAGAAIAIVLLGLGGLLSRPASSLGRSAARAGLLGIVDLVVFSVAFIGAYLIRFEWEIPPQYLGVVKQSIPLFLGIKFLVFAALGLYSREGRPGVSGTLRILYATGLGSLLAMFVATMAWRFEDYSRAVFVIDGMVTFLLAWGVRQGSSLLGETLVRVAGRDLRVAIVGTAEALDLIAPALGSKGEGQVIGAIRAREGVEGTGGLTDLGPLSRMGEISREHGVRMVWLIPFGMSEEETEKVKAACDEGGLMLREVSLRLDGA